MPSMTRASKCYSASTRGTLLKAAPITYAVNGTQSVASQSPGLHVHSVRFTDPAALRDAVRLRLELVEGWTEERKAPRVTRPPSSFAGRTRLIWRVIAATLISIATSKLARCLRRPRFANRLLSASTSVDGGSPSPDQCGRFMLGFAGLPNQQKSRSSADEIRCCAWL